MTADARRLLSLLALLPDGVAHPDLDRVLPGMGNGAASVLRRVSLAFDAQHRLRLLLPTREHVREHLRPIDDDWVIVVRHFLSLGDIALERSDHDAARQKFEVALGLYLRIGEPYSVGWANVRLARLSSRKAERDELLKAARGAWKGIDRPDLLEQLEREFGHKADRA